MTKNGSKATKWISIGITLTILVLGIYGTFIWAQADIKAVDIKADNISEGVTTLKKEGCDPTDMLKYKMLSVEKDMETVQKDIADFRSEQTTIKENTAEILRRLPK